MPQPTIIWDIGTAYDFFISLVVLHNPDRVGLRGAWAAGVRSRLPHTEREFLQDVMEFLFSPLGWIHQLPEPKNAQNLLLTLAAIPPAERLATIDLNPTDRHGYNTIFQKVREQGSWSQADYKAITTIIEKTLGNRLSTQEKKKRTLSVQRELTWWTRAEEFGEKFLAAAQAYYEVFFAEDEARIEQTLQEAQARAQELAHSLPFPDLLEELSQGVHLERIWQAEEVVLTPTFWGSPLLHISDVTTTRTVIAYGGRPVTASIVPGEMIPDALFQALKALADPTRLRILRYLMESPLTPAELARRLRLRPPTVIHHLHILRLAQLVQLRIGEQGRQYAARPDSVRATFGALGKFLETPF
ncbi:MAG: winged helix-turn-helix transcriptional regulator [Chloroflexi bacterium]|nr:winged helix-turn-helix transcriptional regulator [Chloroflexota bacterium]MBP8054332.1 winged helix-turn-helix transcriptional regulator [Chloroflexota bacterium]